MSARSTRELSPLQREAFYARSWGLVHMLVAGHAAGFPDRRAAIQRYLVLLNHGVPVVEACRDAFGVGPARLGAQLDRYLKSDRIPYLMIPEEEIPTHRTDSVRHLDELEALLLMAELSAELRGIDADLTTVLLRAAEAESPGEPRVAAWRALAAATAGEGDASDASLARIDAASVDPAVDRLLARVFLARAGSSEDVDLRDAWVQRARRHVDAALAAEPDSLEGLVLQGKTALAAESDPAPGIAALERARAAMPSATSVHLDLAELYRRAGRWELARERVDVVLQWSGVEEELETAREVSVAVAEQASSPPIRRPAAW